MQSGYGVPEIQLQQFMEDNCGTLLSIAQDISNPSQQQKQQLHHHPQQQRFQQFSPIHIRQQFFHHPPFQRRLHTHFGLDQGPESSHPQPPPPAARIRGGLCAPHFVETNFRLGMTDSGGGREVLQEDDKAAIKEPLWKPLDVEYMNSRKREKLKESREEEEEKENEEGKSSSSNYRLFNELEAIYTHSGGGGGGGGGILNNQAASGSALTGENTGPAAAAVLEASPKKLNRRKKRKRKQMGYFAVFFQSLVKQLMDHQERLHRQFLEAVERREKERAEREEARRRQEAAKESREAAVRAQEQALASSREAAIISFLEKITGESISLPEVPKSENVDKNENFSGVNTRRWPKAEVQALITVRCGLESRFQEPGLKAPLWEEVSSSMAAIGYQRSAKRCKEKWENINKYFRKTKDSAKKRSLHSKTCPYFHQLDQLYSKSQTPKNNSELLEAMVPSDQTNVQNPSLDFVPEFKIYEMGLDFNNSTCNEASEVNARQVLLLLQQNQGNEEEEEEEEGDDKEEDGGEEEGEGESQTDDDNREKHEEKQQPQDGIFFHIES